MLRLHHAVALVAFSLLGLIGACSSPAAPSPDSAVGRWRADPEALSPQGMMVNELTFTAEGRFAADVRSFGLYMGQRSTELSHSARRVGRYQIDGRLLHLQPDSLILADTYSPEAGEVVIAPYPYNEDPLEGATISVSEDRLTLGYLSYPADAPVPTERQYRRVVD